MPDARLVVIPNSGHFTSIDEPERFNEAEMDFLPKRGQPVAPGVPESLFGQRHVGVDQAASYEEADGQSF